MSTQSLKFKMYLGDMLFESLFKYVAKDYKKRIPKLLNLVKRFSPDEGTDKIISTIEEYLQKDPAVQRLIHRVFTDYDPNYASRIFANVILNVGFFWIYFNNENQKKDIPTPYTILISPTMRCNLQCIGCYAGNYTKNDDLPPETVERIIKEGEEIGTYFYTVLGGEPFVYPGLLDIVNRHPRSVFQIFTNATLLDENKIERFWKSKNVVPVLSLEGGKEETDYRRGLGVYEKVVNAMDLLKKAGIPFGYSITLTRNNFEAVTKPEFYQWLANKGAFFGWTFLYMPVGKDDDPSLMPTPEQRAEYGKFIRKIRGHLPIYPMDFWNDAPYVGGCIAGGRRYLHINHKGEVEPCIFAHFAVDNIKEKSLVEVLNSEFFKEIRKRQPFHENLLLPCMIIDSPWILREIVQKTGAHPTHPGADDIITKFAPIIDEYAKGVRKALNPIWVEEFHGDLPEEEKEKVGVE
ncbi:MULTISPECIES: radical SAM protein [Dictyoglomus]|uniref:Radical SAM domain protein n=1 Tax=Dictyoglomus turgidum (strain DSM 6724 / Z-1310) TaxID=515635 RepID=B8E3C3_DICTD|nr:MULTISPECIES: radical SAM protein [Dictyoglomus]ACK42997.1 Radical SAM domain protein [Dictyoglomus turgidum DSM 6724]HBU31062.1 radical SAM protein [Dictyoglomus sp.]